VLGITRRHEGVFSEISEFLAKLLNGAEEVSMPLPGMSLDFYSPDEGTAITALCQRGGGQNHRRCRARVRSNKTGLSDITGGPLAAHVSGARTAT
jgi:hypothetical protein